MGLVACTLVINLGILFGSCRPYYRMYVWSISPNLYTTLLSLHELSEE